MATEVERKRVESAVLEIVREQRFVCPECGKPTEDIVMHPEYGFICALCDTAITISEG